MICSNMDIDNDIVDKECRLGKYKHISVVYLRATKHGDWYKIEMSNCFRYTQVNVVCMMSSFTAFYFQNKQ